MNLYQLSEEYLALKGKIESQLESEEQDECSFADFFKVDEALEEKILAAGYVIKSLEAEAAKRDAAVAHAKQVLEDLKSHAEQPKKQAERLLTQMAKAMESTGKASVDSPHFKVTLRKQQPELQVDELDIPEEYRVQTVSDRPDKQAIRKALKEGAAIPGAKLVDRPRKAVIK